MFWAIYGETYPILVDFGNAGVLVVFWIFGHFLRLVFKENPGTEVAL